MDSLSSTTPTIIQNIPQLQFGWTDYILFGGLLGVSLLIGIYFGFFSKQNSTSEYLFGGKSMAYLPVAISIIASYLSGITFIGYPTDTYYHGAMLLITSITTSFVSFITAHIFLPIFYDLQIVSTFEYLEMRFSKPIRRLASLMYTISLLLYIPIVVFVPSLVFSEVTGHSVHVTAPIFSFVCITYTTMGGVKAVVWTDTIQFMFTVGSLFIILVIGINDVGGLTRVYDIAKKGGRLEIDFDPSPFTRNTVWGMTVGMICTDLIRITLAQKLVQRFLSIKRKIDMQKAAYLSVFGSVFLKTCCILYGLVVYAKYHDCDPLTSNIIKRTDDLVPHYVMEMVGHIPGLPGVFLAGLVSSALSTMSASLNALSGIIYEDFIDCWIPDSPNKDEKSANIMKVLSVIIGLVTIALVFVIERLGTILEMAFTLSTACDGPLLGFFIVGIFLPWVGKKGALTGAMVSLVFMTWLLGGMQWHVFNKRIVSSNLPSSIENCPFPINKTLHENLYQTTPTPTIAPEDEPWIIFRTSMLFLNFTGSLIVVIVALITSTITGESNMTDVNPQHVSFLVRRFLPEKKYVEVPLKEVIKEKPFMEVPLKEAIKDKN